MLRNILAELDGDCLVEQSRKLVEDTSLFSLEANQLLRRQPALVDFFNITEILLGEDAYLGAGAILLFLKDAGKADQWLGSILKSLDREFCLASADLLIKGGRSNDGWNFSKKTQSMLENECPVFAYAIKLMALRFGVGFTIGAYLQLELLRRREENDFGMESDDLPVQ